MKTKIRILIVLTVLTLIISSSAFSEDWTQWRGKNRQGKVSDFTAPETWPEQLTEVWTQEVGSGDATPALVGDKLYVFTRKGSEEITMCLKASDGSEVWSDKYEAQEVTGAASRHPGPRSSPTVADGKVFTLGVGGVLSCLNSETGDVVWRNEDFKGQVPRFFTSLSPIVTDGMCIAHLGGDSGTVIALDLATGDEKWKWTGDAPTYSSPALMTAGGVKQVVVQTAENLIGLAVADGRLLWKMPTPTQRRFYNAPTPLVDGQTIYHTGGGQGSKAIKINKEGEEFKVEELWTNPDVGATYTTPILNNGKLYGLSNQGNLYCINAQDGKTVWKDSAEHENFGEVVDAGSVLFALPSDAQLLVYKPGTEEYTPIASYKPTDKAVYAYPIISGKNIYIKDEDSLIKLAVE